MENLPNPFEGQEAIQWYNYVHVRIQQKLNSTYTGSKVTKLILENKAATERERAAVESAFIEALMVFEDAVKSKVDAREFVKFVQNEARVLLAEGGDSDSI